MKKIIFLNVGWMGKYKGSEGDRIVGGGAFVQKHGYGHEIFNFLPYNGYMYGYVRPNQDNGTIEIARLGASKQDDSIENVLVVWVAKRPKFHTVVIGWYKNATVFRNEQCAPNNSNRKFGDEKFGYYVRAKQKDCTCLPEDNRIFRVPRGEGGMGQSNVWYADQERHKRFKQDVLPFIERRIIPQNMRKQKAKGRKRRKVDLYRQQKVEKIAVMKTVRYYENLGYEVDSVEKDNLGWDLEAALDNLKLRIEVKGLSGEEIFAELTPNEYKEMRRHKDSYRISVVTNALTDPSLTIFSYSLENGKWENEKGDELTITPIESARLTCGTKLPGPIG